MASSRTQSIWDVAIVGGGLVGMSLALALSRATDLRVLAIDAQPTSPEKPSWDERHFALGRASVLALETLGVELGAASRSPIRRIHVSRRGAFGRTLFDATAHRLPDFGQVVPARQLVDALQAALERATGLTRWRPARLHRFAVVDNHVDLEVEIGAATRIEQARLLVAADGTDSAIRAALSIPVQRHDYRQTAIVSVVEVESDLDGCAFERFIDRGAIALLPLGGHRAGLVMSLTDEDAASALAATDHDYLAFAERSFGSRLGRWRRVGRRQSWPLRLVAAERIVDRRVVLIGNAAQTIHPIGAQGFNLGLRDALTLAEVILGHRDAIGSAAMQSEYAERRRDDRAGTVRFADTLARFMAGDLPIEPLRSFALLSVEHLPWVRDGLVRMAMGFR